MPRGPAKKKEGKSSDKNRVNKKKKKKNAKNLVCATCHPALCALADRIIHIVGSQSPVGDSDSNQNETDIVVDALFEERSDVNNSRNNGSILSDANEPQEAKTQSTAGISGANSEETSSGNTNSNSTVDGGDAAGSDNPNSNSANTANVDLDLASDHSDSETSAGRAALKVTDDPSDQQAMDRMRKKAPVSKSKKKAAKSMMGKQEADLESMDKGKLIDLLSRAGVLKDLHGAAFEDSSPVDGSDDSDEVVFLSSSNSDGDEDDEEEKKKEEEDKNKKKKDKKKDKSKKKKKKKSKKKKRKKKKKKSNYKKKKKGSDDRDSESDSSSDSSSSSEDESHTGSEDEEKKKRLQKQLKMAGKHKMIDLSFDEVSLASREQQGVAADLELYAKDRIRRWYLEIYWRLTQRQLARDGPDAQNSKKHSKKFQHESSWERVRIDLGGEGMPSLLLGAAIE